MEFSGLGRGVSSRFLFGKSLEYSAPKLKGFWCEGLRSKIALSPISASGCVENQLYGYGVACFRVWGSSLEVGVSENRGTSFWGP